MANVAVSTTGFESKPESNTRISIDHHSKLKKAMSKISLALGEETLLKSALK
jgi:hypothetical protein